MDRCAQAVNLEELLGSRKVVVVCGSGGVGKTTTSAALALGMARRGRRACVLTIDPARRLATALGLDELDDNAHEIELGPDASGQLFAMTLDAKRTFDHLVDTYAPSTEARDRILNNRVYGELSRAVAGSQEYMAMEKLYELHESGRYDLLVLDTPPTRHALDFLEAPGRITRFVEGRTLRAFLGGGISAGRFGLRGLGSASTLAWKTVERVAGFGLLAEVSEFFVAFEGMYDGFKERAEAVRVLLEHPDSVFLLVTSPEREPIDQAVCFWRTLVERQLPFGGVIVNRVHTTASVACGNGLDSLTAAARADLEQAGVEGDLVDRVVQAFVRHESLARRDAANISALAARLGAEPLLEVPHLESEVNDVAGLDRLDEHLFSGD